jgi:hypothetical protein
MEQHVRVRAASKQQAPRLYEARARKHLVVFRDFNKWGAIDFINFARDAANRRHCFPTTKQRLALQRYIGSDNDVQGVLDVASWLLSMGVGL